jgi:hypothetical protein
LRPSQIRFASPNQPWNPSEESIDHLLLVILCAGRRTGTPAGLLSALRAAQGLLARYAEPEPAEEDGPWEISTAPLPVVAGECWCGRCGEVAMTALAFGARVSDELIACCRRPQLVAVTEILRAEEYYIR